MLLVLYIKVGIGEKNRGWKEALVNIMIPQVKRSKKKKTIKNNKKPQQSIAIDEKIH